jgi:hypothetical protein
VHMSCGSQQQDNSTQHNPPSMRAGSCQIIPVCVSTGPQIRDSLQKTETNYSCQSPCIAAGACSTCIYVYMSSCTPV